MNGVVYGDDGQVVDLWVSKRYVVTAGVRIEAIELNPLAAVQPEVGAQWGASARRIAQQGDGGDGDPVGAEGRLARRGGMVGDAEPRGGD